MLDSRKSSPLSAVSPPIAMVFDCDGVLLDSNRLKTDSFRDSLLEHGYGESDVAEFVKLQKRSFGTSRYRQFEMFFTEILKREVDAAMRDSLLAAFGRKCREGYMDSQPTLGCLDLLESVRDRYPLYIASGSDEAELRDVFAARGLDRYFNAIYGSPTPKSDLLRRIVVELQPEDPKSVWFFGDAKADFEAARAASAQFFFVAAYSSDRANMEALAAAESFPVIETLANLPPVPTPA